MASSIINEARFISIRSLFDKPRVGIIMSQSINPVPHLNTPSTWTSSTPSTSTSSTPVNSYNQNQKLEEAIGFVFANYEQSVEQFRNDFVDQLLKDIILSSNLISRIPNIPDYKFLDTNEWPVLRIQEEKLTLINLLTNESNIKIQMKSRNENYFLEKNFSSSNNYLQTYNNNQNNGCNNLTMSRQSDQGYGSSSDTTDHPKASAIGNENCSNNAIVDTIRTRSMDPPITSAAIGNNCSIYNSMDGNFMSTFNLERSASGKQKKKGSINRKKPVSGPKPNVSIMSSKPIKSKSLAHPIMLSYARQEAAQHALDLKIELERLGYSAYLDVHEITSGADWQDSLNYAVNNCVVFVPLVTPMYGNTQWTNREVSNFDTCFDTSFDTSFDTFQRIL